WIAASGGIRADRAWANVRRRSTVMAPDLCPSSPTGPSAKG
ncbi:MAG: hypothetical protein AVDCRST_MAG49-2853, partial [uncultured Thermomicrobiales bacterium]